MSKIREDLGERKENLEEKHDVSLTINASVDKFKRSRDDVEFVLDIDKKSTVFRGSRQV